MACDPDYASVVLLAHFDVADSFKDFSSYNLSSGPIGAPSIDTVNFEFGDGSLNTPSAFGFNSNDGVVFAHNAAQNPTDQNFTIECWVRWSGILDSVSDIIRKETDNSGGAPFLLRLLNAAGQKLPFFLMNRAAGYSNDLILQSDTELTAGTWHYLAVTREGQTFRMFLDGVVVSTYTSSESGWTAISNTEGIVVGAPFSFAGFAGQIDEVRITIGVCRYNSNFAPPTEPFGVACDTNVEVPDVVGELLAVAQDELTSFGLVAGTVTYVYDGDVSAGVVISQSPVGGTVVAEGSAVDLVVSLGFAPITVPDVVGQTFANAQDAIIAAGLTVGAVTTQISTLVPAGTVISQELTPGSVVPYGTPMAIVVSLGEPEYAIVPDVVGETIIDATTTIQNANFVVGSINRVEGPGPRGEVVAQFPPAGAAATFGSAVNITVYALVPGFDVNLTVISQYANSPTLLRLVQDMDEYLDVAVDFEAFFDFVWNVNTAQGFGLDIWGRIVDVPRLLQIPATNLTFGFKDGFFPLDVAPFNNAPFNSRGGNASQSYLLPDDAYRVLILTKALANIVSTTAPALNQLLKNLFPGRGECWVQDLGNMAMQFTFAFPLSTVEYAILSQSGALPHPAGVMVTIVTLDSALTFGFAEAGPPAQPFDQGVFYIPAG